ncbi:hypothetical protein [Actinomadura sp. KC345]|uniref:hypothetical protein n=1 Tax=Actinomadura sp. KC345 TaxID=2530371 RepID=UPI001A9D93A4|nr:hypothetical protein [Actinomadura sp. KC345]
MQFTARTGLVLAAAVATVTSAAPTARAAQDPPPDPAPGGPQRPYEPDVEGPENLDGISVTATRSAGRGVTVAFDRRSRTADGSVPWS